MKLDKATTATELDFLVFTLSQKHFAKKVAKKKKKNHRNTDTKTQNTPSYRVDSITVSI